MKVNGDAEILKLTVGYLKPWLLGNVGKTNLSIYAITWLSRMKNYLLSFLPPLRLCMGKYESQRPSLIVLKSCM